MTTELPQAYDPRASAAKWSAAWNDSGLFRANPDAPGEPFVIVIPPPNITGHLHMGHALNNTLQDVLVRYKRMDGFNVLWVPGTDHAGIATQWVVRRQLEARGIFYRDLGREGFVEEVWKWKEEAGGTIATQLRRLGVSADWSRERFTLDPKLATAVTEHFVRLYEAGLIYRGERLINWDPYDQTALSDLEVEEDKEHVGQLFSFAYPLSDGDGEIVVATTRPETMLGDTAIAVHPDDPRYQHLIGKTVRHPLVARAVPIIGDAILVDPKFGSGAVKLTPAHDPNDFATGKRHNLQVINLLNPDGTYNDNAGEFSGMDRFDVREAVEKRLEELGLFRGREAHKIPLPRSQRSKAIVEPMLSTQWFVRMKPLAAPAVAAVENGFTRFVPQQWENTYYAWMRNIQDWCISRQLWWGHRIPAWYCADCKEVTVSRTTPDVCAHCASARIKQDDDVLDTWFSSALWPFSVFGWPERTPDLQRYYPTTVLVTAFDIIFFWVARMMVAGLQLTGSVPFRDVYIHALIRDEKGRKMSKTVGNVVDPLESINDHGADAFRFTLIAMAAQGRDILWNEDRVEANRRFITKIWQARRFCEMVREDYVPGVEIELGPYDRWIQARAGAAVARVREALDAYKFNEAASEIYAFTWGEYCDWYLELAKTTIYDESASPARKNAVRHMLFETMGTIVRLLHPIMPYLTEEIWHGLPGKTGFVASAPFPRASDYPHDPAVLDDVAAMQEAVTEVRRIRAEMELGGKHTFTLLIEDDALRGALERHGRALRHLANAAVAPLTSRPKGVATAVVRGREVTIPLEGIVDFAKEVARLDKGIAKAEEDVGQLQKRLSNPSFVERAAPEAVEEVRTKFEAAKVRRDTLARSRERLAAAIQE